jgi:hypothetical protein
LGRGRVSDSWEARKVKGGEVRTVAEEKVVEQG